MKKRAKENLELIRFTVDSAADAAYWMGPDAHFIYVNQAACQSLGYSRDELLTMSVHDIDPNFSQEVWPAHWQELRQRKSFTVESHHRRKDGDIFPVEITVNHVKFRGREYNCAFARDISERKQFEQAQRESEEKYRTLVEESFDGIFVQKGTRITFANSRLHQMLGYQPGELEGLEHWRVYHPDYQQLTSQRAQARMRGEQVPSRYEVKVQRKDGSSFHAEISAKAITLEGEAGIQVWVRDISESKQARDALRRSEERLRAILEASPDPVVVYDQDGRTTYFNPAFTRVFGWKLDELMGRTIPFVPDDQREATMATIKKLFQHGESVNLETRRFTKDGALLDVYISAAGVMDPLGRVEAMVVNLTDITERKRAARALQESEAKMRGILDNIKLGVALISPQMEIMDLNQRMRKWFPDIDSDQRPFCFHAFYDPPLEGICDFCPIHKTLEDGLVHEATMQRQWEGAPRNYRIFSSPILDASGEVTAVIEIVEDTTEKISLESQLRHAQKMEAVGRLAGGVAHDFNNMLGVIIGHVELALDQVDPSQPLFANLQEIQKAAERSADLTRQLLAFARRQTVAPQVLDLNQTVEGMLNMLRRLIGEDIDLAWLPGEAVWPVKVDPSQIDQILANLCVNARDALAGGGKVTIETRTVTFDQAYCDDHAGFIPGDFVMLAVSDNGQGMAKETLEKIFDPFYTTKEMGKGTGLGLATVYGIVKQNQGFINVYSEPEHGTTFKIYLPRHQAETEQIQREIPAAPAGEGHETILLVEDEPAILEMAKQMLERFGYQVLAAATPREAISLAEEHPGDIHLLMTDVVMPEMNGLDLAKNLTALYPSISRLFMSGYTNNVIAHHGVLEENVNYIQKPFSMQDLAAKVREALDSE